MNTNTIMRRIALVLAAAFTAVASVGCTQSSTVTLPGGTPPTSTTTPFPIPGVVTPTLPGSGGQGSTTGPAAQSPVTGILSLARLVSAVDITGCVGPIGTAIPDITQIPLAQAQSTLILDGFTPGTVRWAYSATVSPGNVISQDPAAGTRAASGTTVNMLASLGPQLGTVPDVVGKPQAEAEALIVAEGFKVGAVSLAYSASVPSGMVLTQDPEGGTTTGAGATVDLVVSQGPQPVAVPNVVGLSRADALATIAAAGLSAGSVVQGSSETVPVGIIMSQTPAAGTMQPPGTPVDMVVSQGPEPVAIPDVVGKPQDNAQATLTGAGFVVGIVTQAWSASAPQGSVISQDPAAGTVMIPGTPVNLVVSKGPEPVAVPYLAGKTQADAQSTLVAAGLAVGTVTQEYSATAAEGTVIGQNPAEGTLLAPGGSVSLVIAKKTLSLCDYYPLAVGNTWETPGSNGSNGITAQIVETFVINGCQCWKLTSVDHGANDKVTNSYLAQAGGWMYSYESLDDLFLLPGVAPKARKIAPQTVTPGVSFVTNFNNASLSVTPVVGRLSDFVSDTSRCPFGNVQDTVALKLGNIVLIVFGRNLGPLYYNYLTDSGFYSAITIVGGCGSL